MGYPLTTKEYGGAWLYGSKDNVVSLGFVHRPRLSGPAPRSAARPADVQAASFYCEASCRRQNDPLRREVAALWWLVVTAPARRRRLDAHRGLHGFLNSARLKGIHLAIKSGMLAAETAFAALIKDDSSAATLSSSSSASKAVG